MRSTAASRAMAVRIKEMYLKQNNLPANILIPEVERILADYEKGYISTPYLALSMEIEKFAKKYHGFV